MSYVIQVWEQPVPAAFEDAEDILDRLFREGADKPSAKLDQLVKTLWARYPKDLETDSNDPVWADTFSKDGREPLKVETLAIATPHLDEMVPVVAKTATALGLVAYDPQYGTVYLPDGRTLGQTPLVAREAAPAKPAAPAALLDVDDATSRFVAGMGSFMAARGFAWKKAPTGDGWVRAFPGGLQKITPLIAAGGGSVGLALHLSANLFAVDEHVHRFKNPRKPAPIEVLFATLSAYLKAAGHPGAGLFQPRGTSVRILVNTSARLDAAVAAIQEIVPTILDEMHGFESLAGLWRNALDEAQGRRTAHFTESIEAKMVAGKLLGATELDQVADAQLMRYEAGLAARREGASEFTLGMLAREEGEIKDALVRLREFVRTQMRALK